MQTARFALVLIAAAGLALSGCAQRDPNKVHADVAEDRIAELERQLEEANAKNTHSIIQQGGGDREAVGQGDKDIDVSKQPYGVHITIDNSVLFKPGKAELSSQAKGVLARVTTLIAEKYPDHEIQVVGHTDNQQITRSKDQWDDNWDLAGGRARVVLHHLHSKGIAYSRLSFAGYADQKPRQSNGNESGRAKNRRVEIVVIPKNAQSIDATSKSSKVDEPGS